MVPKRLIAKTFDNPAVRSDLNHPKAELKSVLPVEPRLSICGFRNTVRLTPTLTNVIRICSDGCWNQLSFLIEGIMSMAEEKDLADCGIEKKREKDAAASHSRSDNSVPRPTAPRSSNAEDQKGHARNDHYSPRENRNNCDSACRPLCLSKNHSKSCTSNDLVAGEP